jgi:hypothetical protein
MAFTLKTQVWKTGLACRVPPLRNSPVCFGEAAGTE